MVAFVFDITKLIFQSIRRNNCCLWNAEFRALWPSVTQALPRKNWIEMETCWMD